MEKLNKKVALLGTIAAALIIAPSITKAATTLPSAVDGKITLTEDVELSSTWINTENLELDLAGYKITKAPERMYAINNKGTLKITDSSEEKTGMIECTSENITGTRVCVNNYENTGDLTLDGVTVKAKTTAVKNNENARLVIKNSELIAEGIENEGIALQNFGTTTVTDSYIKGYFALDALSYKEFSSELSVSQTLLEGEYAAVVRESTPVAGQNPEIKVNLEDVVLDTENLYKRDLNNSTGKLTLSGGIGVLEGKTLVIDENVELGEDTIIVLDENASVENKTENEITAAYITNPDIENLEDLSSEDFELVTVNPNEKVTAKKEEVNNPEENTTEENEEIKVPNTVDGVTTYIIIAIISLLGLAITITKLRKN